MPRWPLRPRRPVTMLLAGAALALLVVACAAAAATPAPSTPDAGRGPAAPMAVAPGTPFTLAPGESVGIGTDGWRLAFVGAGADSRCPTGVACVRAGDVTLHLRATAPGGAATDVSVRFGEGADSATFGGYTLKVVDVQPQPAAGQTIPASAYRATLVVR